MTNKIDITKSLPQEQWAKFFDQFSEDNSGRSIAIEIIDAEVGDEALISNAPLMAIIYDRPGKGDDLVIETGKNQVNYAHTINSPTEISTAQNQNGEIVVIQITDATDTKTLVKLQAS